MNILHFTKVTITEFKMTLASEFEYRWQVFVWVASDIVQPLIFAMLWSSVAQNSNRGITASDMISYYFMVAIVTKLTADWSLQFMSNSIISGEFSKYLIRPFNYLAEMLGKNLAIRFLRLLMLIPFMISAWFVMGDQLNYVLSVNTIILFVIAVIIGFSINFLMGNIIALLSIFTKQVAGLRALYINVVAILSGEYIPLATLAVGTFFFFELLPFRYTLSFPIEIITGSLHHSEIQRGFLIGIIWLLVLVFIYRWFYKVAIRKYEAEGI